VRVLVTGAAGFIGSHVTEALLDAGHDVVALDGFVDTYLRVTKEANLAAFMQRPGSRFHELDLRTADLAPVLEGVDAIIHEAAMPGLPRSWTDLDAYASNNLIATGRLIEAARRTGVRRVVLASTSSVYGASAVGDERMPLRPVSPYGVTKLAAEHLALAHREAGGPEIVILRYFSVYGPRQRPDMAYHRFIEAMLDDRPITVFGDGRQSRSNTYVEDAVRGTLQALDHGEDGEAYNIGGGERLELLDAIEVIAASLGVKPDARHEPARPGDQRDTAADVTKATLALGYRPTVSARDGLARQVAWQRARR